jgi:hypothetical protein
MVYYNCITGNKQTKSDKTHARELVKQKINLRIETSAINETELSSDNTYVL